MGPKLSVSVRKAGVSAMDKFPRTDVFDCRGFYHSPAPEQAVWPIAPARVAKCRTFGGYFGLYSDLDAQISTLAPSSTTRFMGRLKKSVEVAALVTIQAKIASRQCGMPDRPLGRAIIRVTK
jgi:hypothetical protein